MSVGYSKNANQTAATNQKSKKKKASKPHTVYIVKDGDSMHTISQKYGIRLKNLYKMNRKDDEYIPEVGDRLRLR